MRTIQWGDSGITFIEDGQIEARVDFPIGPRGPIDGTINSPERRYWQDVKHLWENHNILPPGAYYNLSIKRLNPDKADYRVDIWLSIQRYAEYTSIRTPVTLGMARSLGEHLQRNKTGGRVVCISTGYILYEWKSQPKEKT